MNSVNNVRDEQWDTCDICGRTYPMSMLVQQKGRLVCERNCVDDLTIERHPYVVAKKLAQAADTEGIDFRFIDRSFHGNSIEEEVL